MKTTRHKQTTYSYKTMKSPVGRLKLVASECGLAAIQWENDDPKRVRLAPLVEDENHSVLLEAERQLNDYFAGKLKRFSLRFDFAGTEFQKEVWRALAAIRRNPISIMVPCHRVIGSDGKLTGYAGGLETKAFLLKTESRKEHRPTATQHDHQLRKPSRINARPLIF